MKILMTVLTLVALSASAFARQNIRPGEEGGIPDRADVNEHMKKTGTKKEQSRKKEVRENQEETDPVFYDSTTSPEEMKQREAGEI